MARARSMCVVVVALVGIALGSDVHANMAKWWIDGESHGALVPQNDTDVRVDSEDLSFVVGPSLARAEVTATYHMTNGGKADSHADVAFVMVSSELASRGGGESAPNVVHASVTIDGVPVEGRIVTEAEVLGPALEAWLGSHPEAETELARLAALPNDSGYSDTSGLRRYAPGCSGDCSDLIRWYSGRGSNKDVRDDMRRATVLKAAEEAIPTEVAGLQHGWSKSSNRRPLSWITFPLAIAIGASRTVSVRYTHIAGSDKSHAVNTVFTYEYLLSPAKSWAGFGDLHVDIDVPADTALQASSIPFRKVTSTRYQANLQGLPNSELSFELMPRQGLVFGMTQPRGYWLLLLAAMALVTSVGAWQLGRVCGRATTRARRVLACVFGTGVAALVWNSVVTWAVSAVVPRHAFGYSYGAGFALILAIVLFAIGAVVVSLVTALRQNTVRHVQ